MKKIYLLSLVAFGSIMLATSCQEDSPLDGEQYIKQVYIVGADQTTNEGLRIVEVPYVDNETSIASISVATGGSLNIDRDIDVTLGEAGSEAIDDYNFKYVDDDGVKYQHLDISAYAIPNRTVKIKAGEVYAVMPIEINTATLKADSLYALTFQIESVSDPEYITKRTVDETVILSFKFINDYSGTYESTGYYYPWSDGGAAGDSVTVSVSRELTALDANTVRFYHLSTVEDKSNLDAGGVTLTIASDNSVVVDSWGDLQINDGGGTYNPDTKKITFWYNYMDGGAELQFSGVFAKDESEL